MENFVWSSWSQGSGFASSILASSGGGCGDGESEEDKATSVSKNHSQAEKRRRDRINAHLATLRKLIPNSDKNDKATILGKAVEHIKELKNDTTELSKVFTIPTDIDEVIIESDSYYDSINTTSSKNVVIKASVCCEDRPELFSELNHALKTLRLTIVQTDMTCLGGRIKCNFILCVENKTKQMDENETNSLKQSLRIGLGRIVSSSSTMSSNYRIKSKRQRFFCSSNYNNNEF